MKRWVFWLAVLALTEGVLVGAIPFRRITIRTLNSPVRSRSSCAIRISG